MPSDVVLRVYLTDVDAFGPDGYPVAWHDLGDGQGVKHLVREQAGHRCVRCHHPYRQGDGEWSRCDDRCRHDGPVRKYSLTDPLSPREVIEITRDDQGGIAIGPAPLPAGWVTDAKWRILTVHHLTGVKADLRWWNLAALCQRCHLTIQGRVQMERVYPWPHSEWFRPYVAGYYAWTYLGENIDRAEAVARMDELLALECVGVVRDAQ